MTVEAYLIKSTACLLLFYGFYRLLLERQSNHHFKRGYLLLTLLGGILLPLVRIPVKTPLAASDGTVNGALYPGVQALTSISSPASTPWDWTLAFYGLGLALFGVFFVLNLHRLIRKIRRNPQEHSQAYTRVLLPAPEPPHTFFKYLFLHARAYRGGEIPDAVIAHEEVHIRQRHSADLLLAELICLLFWFNPLAYLYRAAIRLNHEFLADREVLRGGAGPLDYQRTLLEFSGANKNQPAFVHAFNYSSIKKRIVVMKSNIPKRRQRATTALLVPVAALALYGFTSRIAVYESPSGTPGAEVPEVERAAVQPTALPEMVIIGYSQKEPVGALQDGASRDEMREYDKLASKYNRMIASGNIRIRTAEVDRMAEIYDRMNAKQRADAEPFPDLPSFPSPLTPPDPTGLAGPQPPVAPFPHPPHPPKPPHATRDAQSAHPAKAARPAREARPAKPAHPAQPAPAAAPAPTQALPPPPPAPPDPETHLKELAAGGATFLYMGEEVSGDAALQLFRSGKINYINVRDNGEDEKIVRLSE